MNNSESASVTIEWDPSSQRENPLNYTITTTPDLISGPPPVTTSTSTTITINYNTDYTITITASNCVGSGIPSDVLSVHIGMYYSSLSLLGLSSCLLIIIVNCSDPSPVVGVTFNPFSDTTEGATISFNCEPGLVAERDDVSVCSSNGSWVPNPAHRICSTPPPSEYSTYVALYYRVTLM